MYWQWIYKQGDVLTRSQTETDPESDIGSALILPPGGDIFNSDRVGCQVEGKAGLCRVQATFTNTVNHSVRLVDLDSLLAGLSKTRQLTNQKFIDIILYTDIKCLTSKYRSKKYFIQAKIDRKLQFTVSCYRSP